MHYIITQCWVISLRVRMVPVTGAWFSQHHHVSPISTRRREKISSINKVKQKKKLDLSNLYFQRWDFLDEQSQKPSESYSHSWQTGLHKLLYYGIHRKIPTAEKITFKFYCCRPSPKMVWCILNNWLTQLKSLWQCQWSLYKQILNKKTAQRLIRFFSK